MLSESYKSYFLKPCDNSEKGGEEEEEDEEIRCFKGQEKCSYEEDSHSELSMHSSEFGFGDDSENNDEVGADDYEPVCNSTAASSDFWESEAEDQN